MHLSQRALPSGSTVSAAAGYNGLKNCQRLCVAKGTPRTPRPGSLIVPYGFKETSFKEHVDRVKPHGEACVSSQLVDNHVASILYECALDLARVEEYRAARKVFEALLVRYPNMCKAWVSYAQMEKRSTKHLTMERFERCRLVLQRGLQLNPTSACLAQAWGLMELQKGNFGAAVRLLERCVKLDPNNSPVLKWALVQTAKKTVSSRGQPR